MKETQLVAVKQIAEFRRILQRGPSWTDEQLRERAKLHAQEETASRAAASRTQSLHHLRSEITTLTDRIEGLEARKATMEEENEDLEKRIRSNMEESKHVQGEKMLLEQELQDLQIDLNLHKNTLGTKVSQVAIHKQAVIRIESELHEAKVTMEQYLTEYDALFRETQHVTEQLEKQVGWTSILALLSRWGICT